MEHRKANKASPVIKGRDYMPEKNKINTDKIAT